MSEPKPITRESFITACVDAFPWWPCQDAREKWALYHTRCVVENEIDEDPPACEQGVG
jgi:hypothetical protein